MAVRENLISQAYRLGRALIPNLDVIFGS